MFVSGCVVSGCVVSVCVVSVYVSNEHMADKAHLLIGWLSNSDTASSAAFLVIHCEAPNTEAKLFSFQKYEYVCVECKTVWEINVTYGFIPMTHSHYTIQSKTNKPTQNHVKPLTNCCVSHKCFILHFLLMFNTERQIPLLQIKVERQIIIK